MVNGLTRNRQPLTATTYASTIAREGMAPCARCGGKVLLQRGLDGMELKCQSCGRNAEHDPAPPPENEPNERGRDVWARTASGEDWLESATKRIGYLVDAATKGQAQVTAWRDEAERIRRALLAYGTPNIPDLPWVSAVNALLAARAASHQGPVRRIQPGDTCQKCGLPVVTGRGTWRKRPTGEGWEHVRRVDCKEAAQE